MQTNLTITPTMWDDLASAKNRAEAALVYSWAAGRDSITLCQLMGLFGFTPYRAETAIADLCAAGLVTAERTKTRGDVVWDLTWQVPVVPRSATPEETALIGAGVAICAGEPRVRKGGRPRTSARPRSFSRSYSDQTKAKILQNFEKFWDEYPRKIGRAAAFGAFVKLFEQEPETVELLPEKAKNFAEICENRGTAQRYIPHAVNWLSDRRWEDPAEDDSPTEKSYDWEEEF